VDVEDLLARVQLRGRLHGRNESCRAICAVVEALGEFLSARAFHLIAELLPDDARRHLRRPEATGPHTAVPTCRTFLTAIATRLLLDGPDAAFTARVVLEELNATGRVITPARFAHLVAADLRPLLCATPPPITADETNPAPRRVIRVAPAPLRPAASPASRPASAAPLLPASAGPLPAAPLHAGSSAPLSAAPLHAGSSAPLSAAPLHAGSVGGSPAALPAAAASAYPAAQSASPAAHSASPANRAPATAKPLSGPHPAPTKPLPNAHPASARPVTAPATPSAV
jgi:uncharacterized protein (DUF2267 family)